MRPFVVGGILLVLGFFVALGIPVVMALSGAGRMPAAADRQLPEPGADGWWEVSTAGAYRLTVTASPSPGRGASGRLEDADTWPRAAFGLLAAETGVQIPLVGGDSARVLPWQVGTARLEPGRYRPVTPELGAGLRARIEPVSAVGIAEPGADRVSLLAWGGVWRWFGGMVLLLAGLVSISIGLVRLARSESS